MHYELRDSKLVLLRNGESIFSIEPENALGILYSTDAHADAQTGAMAGILKHGPAERVLQDYRTMWSRLQRAAPTLRGTQMGADLGAILGLLQETRSAQEILRGAAEDLEMVSIPVRDITQAVVEEVNACLATAGRVAGLKERLEGMAASPHP